MPEEKDVEPEKEQSAQQNSSELTAKERLERVLPEHRKVKILGVAMLLIVSLATGFLGGWLGASSRDDNGLAPNTQKQVVLSEGQLISQVAKDVSPSVVSVDVTSTSQDLQSSLFGFTQQSPKQQSAGTGIIISSDGLIVTNRHVVPRGTTNVSVTLSDGTKLKNVEVVGRTNQSDSLDVAFLKITDAKGHKLTPAKLGDSSKVQVGERVVAIGNALGQFQNTVTSGIVSGHGRSVQASDSGGDGSENLEDLFQTDAAINEGNSGGPLVNVNGEVIGINTAIAGNAQDIGFAIPINDTKGLIQSVLSSGELKQPFLGVRYLSLTNDYAAQLKLKVTRGAYVIPSGQNNGESGVIAGSPADKAGVKEKDIIIAVDGTNVDANHSLTSLLQQHAVGDKVGLRVQRGDKTITLNATLGQAPKQ